MAKLPVLYRGAARVAAFFLLASLLTGASAPPAPVQFTAHQMGVAVTGSFSRVTSHLQVDPVHPASASGSVVIDSNSIDLEAADYTDSLKEAEWLDASKFPQASFTLADLHPQGAGSYSARGSLTIKGITHSVTVPVRLASDASGALRASGQFDIHRLDYQLGTGEWADTSTIDNNVSIAFNVPLGKAPAR